MNRVSKSLILNPTKTSKSRVEELKNRKKNEWGNGTGSKTRERQLRNTDLH